MSNVNTKITVLTVAGVGATTTTTAAAAAATSRFRRGFLVGKSRGGILSSRSRRRFIVGIRMLRMVVGV